MSFLKKDNRMNEIRNFADALLPYPNWVRIIIITCILIILSFFLFYPKLKVGKLDIGSLKIAYVEIEKNMFQIGIIVDVTNLTDKPISLYSISFEGEKIEMTSRGSIAIPIIDDKPNYMIITENKVLSKIVGDSFIKPSESRTYKVLLPLKQNMTIKNGSPFEIFFRGDWNIIDSDGQSFNIFPRSYGNYNNFFHMTEWNALNDFKAIEKLPPIRKEDSNSSVENYILYNRDKTAIVNLYGYCNTIYVRSKYGAMVIVRGPENPNLEGGWKILGNNYPQIWRNTESLELYNKIVLPDEESGEPIPFGTFAGVNLGSGKSSATTRCADVITMHMNK